jgi:chromosome partitioning protein
VSAPAFETSPHILAIANQKGGVGKTTTAINLGTALAAAGHRTAVIDLDSQGNATTGLGFEHGVHEVTTYNVLTEGIPIAEAIVDTHVPDLGLAPADVNLAGFETEFGDDPKRAFKLRHAIAAEPLAADYLLIDCPPSLNLLTVNAMTAAHAVLVPLQCEFFALEGLSQLLRTIELVRSGLNPSLEIEGVVLTMYDKRNSLSDLVARDVRSHLEGKVYQTMIPRNVRLSEAPSHGKPALLYDHRCAGSQAYIQLAREMLKAHAAEPA